MDLAEWETVEAQRLAEQRPDGPALLDRVDAKWLAGLDPREALALRCAPEAYCRPPQLPPPDGEWLSWLLMTGRGWGKSFAAASWLAAQIQTGGDYALIAPTDEECWSLQWAGSDSAPLIRELLPPWVRWTERVNARTIVFPDHGARLLIWSGEKAEYRGPNLRGAWGEECVKWPDGKRLWGNLRRAIRVRGATPPRAVLTTTPPSELDWLCELAGQVDTRVTFGTARDNPANDPRVVASWYAAQGGTIEGDRELDGRVRVGVDGALFKAVDLDRYRVHVVPPLERIIVAADPAQSAKRDADPVGLVAAGIAGGHIYVLASCSEQLAPATWAGRAIDWAELYKIGAFVVEPTGSGEYPRATLDTIMRLRRSRTVPIVDSKAVGSKADRAMPLSTFAAHGRLHLVGHHPALERELITWHPSAKFSPGALDALVHGASYLTNGWLAL